MMKGETGLLRLPSLPKAAGTLAMASDPGNADDHPTTQSIPQNCEAICQLSLPGFGSPHHSSQNKVLLSARWIKARDPSVNHIQC
jgi:hypothetical protein